MLVLALDASFGAVSVAVLGADGSGRPVEAEAYVECTTGHAERLTPMLAEVMRRAAVPFTALGRIAVTLGPGSFTGVRTGIAAARALALATGAPVCGTTSLAVMAHGAVRGLGAVRGDRALTVAVDARRGEVYLQSFDGSDLVPVAPPRILAVADAAAALGERDALLVGSGSSAIAAAAARPIETACPVLEPHAADLARLASGLPVLASLDPVYVRAPDAKPSAGGGLPRA